MLVGWWWDGGGHRDNAGIMGKDGYDIANSNNGDDSSSNSHFNDTEDSGGCSDGNGDAVADRDGCCCYGDGSGGRSQWRF